MRCAWREVTLVPPKRHSRMNPYAAVPDSAGRRACSRAPDSKYFTNVT